MSMFNIRKVVISFILSLTIIVSALSLVPNATGGKIAEAGFGACGSLGSGLMSKNNVSTAGLVAPDAAGRKWNVQELFKDSMRFTSYNGEGDKTWYFAQTKDRGKATEGWSDSAVQEKVKGTRNMERCLTGGFQSSMSNLVLQATSSIISLATYVTTYLFATNAICTPDSVQGGSCINLLGIVGGLKQNGGGLIGNLRDSIYVPFTALMLLVTAGWLIYKAFIRREIRASFGGLLWSLVMFVVGIISLYNPMLLAGAPQKLNSTLNTCIVGAMNGQSCLTGDVTTPSTLVGDECRSTASGVGNDGAALATSSMTCSIWKSFVLDSWTRAEFGASYNDLYLGTAPTGGTTWDKAPKDTSIYSVNLQSSGSANSYKGETVETSSVPVKNLALYQLYISTNMKSLGDTKYSSSQDNDPRWFNIIVPMTKDSDMWNHWTPASGYGLIRFFTVFGSLIMGTIIAFSLMYFSIFGLVYLIAGTLLMAFSPLFFLLALDPGKGRRLFLGWLEQAISSVLKYVASSLFVIIALSLYSGILSTSSNYITSFIGVSIMTGVLMLYRKEIINLLGSTSLGGQRLSNAVGDRLNKVKDNAKEFAHVTGGSALGGAIGTASALRGDSSLSSGQKLAKTLKGAGKGVGQGTVRQLKRNQGLAGSIARQAAVSNAQVGKEERRRMAEEAAEAERLSREREAKEKEEKKEENNNNNSNGGSNGNRGPQNGGRVTPNRQAKDVEEKKSSQENPIEKKIKETVTNETVEETVNEYEPPKPTPNDNGPQRNTPPRRTPQRPNVETPQSNQKPLPKSPLNNTKTVIEPKVNVTQNVNIEGKTNLTQKMESTLPNIDNLDKNK